MGASQFPPFQCKIIKNNQSNANTSNRPGAPMRADRLSFLPVDRSKAGSFQPGRTPGQQGRDLCGKQARVKTAARYPHLRGAIHLNEMAPAVTHLCPSSAKSPDRNRYHIAARSQIQHHFRVSLLISGAAAITVTPASSA
jgi:hypothetical protein